MSEICRSNPCECHVLNKELIRNTNSEIPFRVALNHERSPRQDRRTHLRQRLEVVLVNKTRANGETVIKFASKIDITMWPRSSHSTTTLGMERSTF
jgi:hypothetical protein